MRKQNLNDAPVEDVTTPVDPFAAAPGVQVAGLGSIFGPALKAVAKKKLKEKPRPALETMLIKQEEKFPAAEDIASPDLKKIKPELSHQPNYDTMETTDDIKGVIAEMAEHNKGRIEKARRETITQEQLVGLAADLDIEEGVIKEVLSRETGGVLNAERIVAARQVLVSSSARLKELAGKVASPEASDLDRLNLVRQFQFHQKFNQQFMGMRAEAGRALYSFKIPVGEDPAAVARISELTGTFYGQNAGAIAEQLKGVDTVAGINSTVKNFKAAKAANAMYELWVNSILSGIKTHVVNFAGNAMMPVIRTAEQYMAVGVGKAERMVATRMANSEIEWAARTGRFLSEQERITLGEMNAQMVGYISSPIEALMVAGKTMRHGKAAGSTQKLEMIYPKAISSEALEMSGPMGLAVDVIGATIRFPTDRVMAATDDMWKHMAIRGDLARSGYKEAMYRVETGQLDAEMVPGFISTWMERPPKKALDEADAAALYNTFQTPLGEKGRAFQQFAGKLPGARYVMPFVRTPTNIFKAAWERTPLAPATLAFSRKMRSELAAEGPRRHMAIARVTWGSAFAAYVANLAYEGKITGGGSENHKARQVRQSAGIQDYSVQSIDSKTGKITYISYQRGEPLSYIIGAITDMVEFMRYQDPDDILESDAERVTKWSTAIVAGIADNTMSKTFVQGAADFSNMMSDPQRYAPRYVERLISPLIPYAGLRRDLSKIQDPLVREAWKMGDDARRYSGVPGYSKKMPPKLDLYGNPVYQPTGSVLGIFSPWKEKQKTIDPVKLEVVRLMEDSKRVPITKPSSRIEGVRMSADEYYQLVTDSRKDMTDGDGLTFHERLSEVMDSEMYEMVTDDLKVDMLKSVQKGFDAMARQKLLDNTMDIEGSIWHRSMQKKALKLQRKGVELTEEFEEVLPGGTE